MSFDLVVATRRDIDPTDLLLAVDEVAPEGLSPTIDADRGRRVVAVRDGDGRELVWVGPTRSVQRPVAQARRLGLGVLTDDESSWTELCVRERGDLPFARALAERLVGSAGGRVVDVTSADGVPADVPDRTDAVDLPEVPGPAAGAGPASSPPAPFDAAGETECVLVQRRPVLGLGPWLTHALLTASEDGRRLVVVTPPATRLTPVLDRLVHHGALRWVVDDGDRAVEVHRRAPVRWDGDAMVDVVGEGGDAEESLPIGVDAGWALHCETETLLAYDDPAVGRTAEALVAALGLPPLGEAGLMEPGEAPWSVETLTELARDRSPENTRLAVAGDGADGTLSVLPQPGGVLERVELLAEAGDAPRDAAALRSLGEALLDAGVQLGIVGYRSANASRLLGAGSNGAVLPALLVAHPARFPGLTAERLAEAVPGLGAHRPEVMVFPAPDGLEPEESRRTLEQWHAALALLRAEDSLAARAAAAPDGTRGGAYSGR
ncbi:DUF6177 family protein [Phycicoccus avicenniae]|uniref:DUF6177 family protein n=1 Tax=Phycicoccus avicenniae TaxID=2828860 RepID=UPI003D2E5FF4